MYEPYPFDMTVTDIDGNDHAVNLTLNPIVCDRCGRRFNKDELTYQSGYYLCEDCLDEVN